MEADRIVLNLRVDTPNGVQQRLWVIPKRATSIHNSSSSQRTSDRYALLQPRGRPHTSLDEFDFRKCERTTIDLSLATAVCDSLNTFTDERTPGTRIRFRTAYCSKAPPSFDRVGPLMQSMATTVPGINANQRSP